MRWWKRNNGATASTDKELMIAYRTDGNVESLALLFNRYLELVYGVALKYFKNSHDAEDSVMNVYELIAKKLKTHKVDNFKSWLHVVTKNHCLETIRKNKKVLTVASQEEFMYSDQIMHHDDSFEFEWAQNGQLKALEFCMKTLSEEQRKAVKLFYLDGKSYKEAAEILGISLNKVRSNIQNGKRNLKICIEANNG